MKNEDKKITHMDTSSPSPAELKPHDVLDFLCQNPDFLAEHAKIIAEMAPPTRWSGDGVVDLQRFLLDRQSEDLDQLRLAAQEVIETSRGNMSSQTRTHSAVLALLTAMDFDHMMRIINDDLPLLLDIDVASVCFEPGADSPLALTTAAVQAIEENDVDALLGPDHDVRLFGDMEESKFLFGSAASLIRSASLIRLRPGHGIPVGLFVMGSRTVNFFHPRQGTELITFLARVIERCIHRWLETTP